MKKLICILCVVLFLTFFSSKPVFAIYDPSSVSNNKYGIHIINESDIEDASNLVNSNEGDWGYVTLVISSNEIDVGRWQNVFDNLRRNHLIPIVRVATKPQGDIWEKPNIDNIDNWINFFNSLNWVVKNRYIIIGNEPNHAKEWGGKVSPQEYSDYLLEFSKKLKNASDDYFILPAALDASAPNSRLTMEEFRYINEMVKKNPNVFDLIDGWNSHSYPNPAFSAPASKTGKISLQTYKWELNFLKSLGVNKNLPVFITETGWSDEKLTHSQISEYYKYAYENVWDDPQIVAVTPFILNYPDSLFKNFSFKNMDGTNKDFYYTYQNFKKEKGQPIQEVSGKIVALLVSPIEIANLSFSGLLLAKNTGQSIWEFDTSRLIDESQNIEFKMNTFENIEPGKARFITFSGNTPYSTGIYKIPVAFHSQNIKIGETYPFELVVISNLPKVQKIGFFDRIKLAVQELLGP